MSVKEDSKDLFDEDFGDLLDGMEETSEEPVKKPAPVKEPEKLAPTKAAPKEDLDDMPEVGHFAPAGTKISSVPIPRFKASATGKARMTILSKNVMWIKTHFVQGLGAFECFGGKCCELEGMPRVRYVFPVAQYEINSKGAIISDDIQVKALCLSDDTYEALMNAIDASGRALTDVDILVTCSDEQYQKLTFAADATKGASWKSFPDPVKAKMKEFYKANINKLGLGIAKKISLETYMMKKGFVGAPGAQAPNVENPEDLLDE